MGLLTSITKSLRQGQTHPIAFGVPMPQNNGPKEVVEKLHRIKNELEEILNNPPKIEETEDQDTVEFIHEERLNDAVNAIEEVISLAEGQIAKNL